MPEHSRRAVGNHAHPSPGRRPLSADPKVWLQPAEAGRTECGSYSSTADQAALEARSLLRAGNRPERPRIGQPGTLPFKGAPPEGGAPLLQRSRAGTAISVRFRRPRRDGSSLVCGTSPRNADDLCLMPVRERYSPPRPFSGTSPVIPPLRAAASEETGHFPCCRSSRPARGRVAHKEPGRPHATCKQAACPCPKAGLRKEGRRTGVSPVSVSEAYL